MRRHLVLFLRQPGLGRGKRRLARGIGDVAALRFERLMLALLLRRLGRDRRWELTLFVTPDRARTALRRELRRGYRLPPAASVRGQGGGDLGERMRRALDGGPAGPVVLVGTDIPGLEARHVWAAFRRLGTQDLVFGPAEDGGFWLLGARRSPRPPPSFGAVRWSGPHALADTLANLPPGLRIGFVDRLADVDDAASWRRLAPRRGF
jgi:rSAM/selenodomain-associated transferase 1